MTPISKFLIGRTQFFFQQKCSLDHTAILSEKKSKKKHFPKSGRDPMDRPYIRPTNQIVQSLPVLSRIVVSSSWKWLSDRSCQNYYSSKHMDAMLWRSFVSIESHCGLHFSRSLNVVFFFIECAKYICRMMIKLDRQEK